MPTIILSTKINAPIEQAFNLARSIDLHKATTTGTKEEAIAGRTEGLMQLNETVTWRAKHLGVTQQLTVKMVDMEKPYYFRDTMLKGTFKSMSHLHRFEKIGESSTLMTDRFEYASPLGILGQFADWLFLKRYMTNFLINRNDGLKNVAENNE
jgi:ligand-binding SRPBCC domain-containing protein